MTKHELQFFHRGMLAALAVVVVHDEETLYREIVGTTDEKQLIAVARRDGSMQWSGLSKYRYGRKQEARGE